MVCNASNNSPECAELCLIMLPILEEEKSMEAPQMGGRGRLLARIAGQCTFI